MADRPVGAPCCPRGPAVRNRQGLAKLVMAELGRVAAEDEDLWALTLDLVEALSRGRADEPMLGELRDRAHCWRRNTGESESVWRCIRALTEIFAQQHGPGCACGEFAVALAAVCSAISGGSAAGAGAESTESAELRAIAEILQGKSTAELNFAPGARALAYTVWAFWGTSEDTRLLQRTARSRIPHCVVGPADASGVLVLVVALGQDPPRDWAGSLAAAGPSLRGACLEVAEPGQIPGALRSTREIVDVVRALGFDAGVYRMQDVAEPLALARCPDIARAVAARVAPLRSQKLDLIGTLEVFFGHKSDRVATARDLKIHPNTLDYRLQLVGRLTGLSPTSHPEGARLSAGITAYRLLEALC